MISAFDGEIGWWIARRGGVTFLVADPSDDPMVCHFRNVRCHDEAPHRMTTCEMFDVPRDTIAEIDDIADIEK